MVLATLGGMPLRTNPTDIRWNYRMKTVEQRTMGGKVIQILGTTFSDITISGTFGRGRRDKGDTEGWQHQVRFRRQVQAWTKHAAENSGSKPLRFTYAPRGWDFQVFIRSFSDVHMSNDTINPSYTLVLFPVDDGARQVIRGIKDLYIKRLMDGVGWKQTAYNGPTQDEVDATLSPYNGSAHDYFTDQYAQVFAGNQTPQGANNAAATTDLNQGGGGTPAATTASRPVSNQAANQQAAAQERQV